MTNGFLLFLCWQKELLGQQHLDQALHVVGTKQAFTALPELQGPGFNPHQCSQIAQAELFRVPGLARYEIVEILPSSFAPGLEHLLFA